MDGHIPRQEAVIERKAMTIVYSPTLLKQSQALQAAIAQLVQRKRIPQVLIIYPNRVPVYSLGLQDVVKNAEPAAAATLVAWRYFAGGESPAGTVAGDLDPAASAQVKSLTYGSTALDALESFKALASIPGLPDQGYEPRMLRIPGLLVEAYWLVPPALPPGNQAGYVIPYHTLLEELDPKKAYPVDKFFTIIRPLASKALAGNEYPKNSQTSTHQAML